MKNYGSIIENIGDALLGDDSSPRIAVRSYKRYYVVGGLVTLGLFLFYVGGRSTISPESVESYQNVDMGQIVESSLLRTDGFMPDTEDYDKDELLCNVDDECGSDRVCCPYSYSNSLTKRAIKQAAHFALNFKTYKGVCEMCCTNADCVSQDRPPPIGEIGTPHCDRETTFTCQAFANGENSQIPKDGYFVWMTSETLDNSKEFHKLVMPRKVLTPDTPEPIMDQVWYFDFNNQDPGFNKDGVIYDEVSNQITIPSFDMLHAGYSRSYHHYDQHDTGITTLIAGDNSYSVVTPFPKSSFVEKYHPLTYSGVKDTARADYIKPISERQMKDNTHWLWGTQKAPDKLKGSLVLNLSKDQSIASQIDAGVDIAHLWQVRRYVKSYPHNDTVPLSPGTSSRWKSHTEKAKQAIRYAKDPNFEREYLKSEQHCKHFENGEGVDATRDSVTFPLGRPFTTLSGEMVTSPEYYIGFGTGYSTAHYDVNTNVLQIYFQTFSHSRQHSDIKFPGIYPSGLYLTPVAKGDDYAVNPDIDGRSDWKIRLTKPDKYFFSDWFHHDEADFTLWNYDQSVVCDPETKGRKFWENIDIKRRENSIYDSLMESKRLLQGTVQGIPCATSWMRSDYEKGTHAYGSNEIAVWVHTIGEIRGDKITDIGLGDWWNSWECFFQDKDPDLCTNFG